MCVLFELNNKNYFKKKLEFVTREWTDKQVISHLAFVPSIIVVLFFRQPMFLEPLLFIVPLLILSTMYHRHREPCGTLLSRTELCAAFLLYFYGWLQLFYSPNFWTFVLCAMCCAATSVVYVLTNPLVQRIDWDTWHYIGMHIVPGIWAFLVASCNNAVFNVKMDVDAINDIRNEYYY